MQKILLYILLLCLTARFSAAQETYRTQPVSGDIKTVQVTANGDWLLPPVIKLNSDDYVTLKFDKLSIQEPRLRYRLIHCNADWTPSGISEMEYLSGLNGLLINNYIFSQNTTVNYIHYSLQVPNNDIQLKTSGNYTVIVSEDNNPDNVLLTACFSVVEPLVQIRASVSGNTDIDFNKGHQQVSFEINHAALPLRDPANEIKVTVQQNNRLDNRRQNVKPTFLHPNRMVFEHNRDLIFEAGNEYRRFETTGTQSSGLNVYQSFYEQPFMQVVLFTDEIRANRARQYDKDQNGRFFIRNARAYDSDTEADYTLVHFALNVNETFMLPVYIDGGFAYGNPKNYPMTYDSDTGEYRASVLLKQGAYNYQYLTPSLNGFSAAETEGNYYETQNEYAVWVYYRAPGSRYDRLAGFLQTDNR